MDPRGGGGGHPSGDKEVGGGEGVVRSFDRSIERSGNGTATERQRIGLVIRTFNYYSITHSR